MTICDNLYRLEVVYELFTYFAYTLGAMCHCY